MHCGFTLRDFRFLKNLKLVTYPQDDISELDENGLLGARVRSNPFETIRSSIFMNRAAVKIANLDAVLQFNLTNPKTRSGHNFVSPNDLLYFADVCAGPGGFSE